MNGGVPEAWRTMTLCFGRFLREGGGKGGHDLRRARPCYVLSNSRSNGSERGRPPIELGVSYVTTHCRVIGNYYTWNYCCCQRRQTGSNIIFFAELHEGLLFRKLIMISVQWSVLASHEKLEQLTALLTWTKQTPSVIAAVRVCILYSCLCGEIVYCICAPPVNC